MAVSAHRDGAAGNDRAALAVIEQADPPRRLVHTYRFLFSEEMKAEGSTRGTWEMEKVAAGFSRLTVH